MSKRKGKKSQAKGSNKKFTTKSKSKDKGPTNTPALRRLPNAPAVKEDDTPPIAETKPTQPVKSDSEEPARCFFFELPREVRDMIYDEVFDGAYVIFSRYSGWARHKLDAFQVATASTENAGVRYMPSGRIYQPRQPYFDQARINAAPFNGKIVPAKATELCKEIYDENGKPLNDSKFPHQVTLNTSAMFVNKQMAIEMGEFCYAKTVFAVTSPGKVMKLLREIPREQEQGRLTAMSKATYTEAPDTDPVVIARRISLPRAPIAKINLTFIRHFAFEIQSHGCPLEISKHEYQNKYYAAWTRACRLLVEKCENLQHVAIFVAVPWRPHASVPNIGQEWAAPFLEFAKAKKLEDASIRLKVPIMLLQHRVVVQGLAEMIKARVLGFDDETAKCHLIECLEAYRREVRKLNHRVEREWLKLCEANGITYPHYSHVLATS